MTTKETVVSSIVVTTRPWTPRAIRLTMNQVAWDTAMNLKRATTQYQHEDGWFYDGSRPPLETYLDKPSDLSLSSNSLFVTLGYST